MPVASPTSIAEMVSANAERIPTSTAFLAPGRQPLTFKRLYDQLKSTVQTLNSLGIGRNDRVALSGPQNVDLGVAFLGIASGATCVPLNPSLSLAELRERFSMLRVKALVVQAGWETPAREAARGMPIIEFSADPGGEAGIFTLSGGSAADKAAANGGFATSEDIALVMTTSGTTAKP